MADLSSIERRKLERLLRMSGGYVLDFTDRTFSEFFEEHTRRDINAAAYHERGTSKANRLRGFWVVEGNHLVGKVIQALILYGQAENCLGDEPELTELSDDCWKIASRMMCDIPVAEQDALTATVERATQFGHGFAFGCCLLQLNSSRRTRVQDETGVLGLRGSGTTRNVVSSIRA